jgi:hypothetical protein
LIEQGLPGRRIPSEPFSHPILDHYCHTLRRFSQSLGGDSLQRFFVETIDPARSNFQSASWGWKDLVLADGGASRRAPR